MIGPCPVHIWCCSVHTAVRTVAYWGPLKTGWENSVIVSNSAMHCSMLLKFGKLMLYGLTKASEWLILFHSNPRLWISPKLERV